VSIRSDKSEAVTFPVKYVKCWQCDVILLSFNSRIAVVERIRSLKAFVLVALTFRLVGPKMPLELVKFLSDGRRKVWKHCTTC